MYHKNLLPTSLAKQNQQIKAPSITSSQLPTTTQPSHRQQQTFVQQQNIVFHILFGRNESTTRYSKQQRTRRSPRLEGEFLLHISMTRRHGEFNHVLFVSFISPSCSYYSLLCLIYRMSQTDVLLEMRPARLVENPTIAVEAHLPLLLIRPMKAQLSLIHV